jgi:nucleotide-binding universal stress UspA family protein
MYLKVEKKVISVEMKNIIVPLDFSTDAYKGLDLALLIAKHTPVKIQMVYVLKKSDVPSIMDEDFRNAEKNFKNLLETYKNSIPKGSQLTYIIKKGKVYQEIVSQAEAFSDSLIVASTHGASGFEELFIGSNAYRMVSATSRPVITLRQLPVPKTISKIVLPIDFVVESRQKVVYTSMLAQLFNAEVHVVTVTSSNSKRIVNRLAAYSAQICNYLKSKDIPYVTESLIGNNPINQVLKYSENVGAELISIINESGESITDFIIGGEAQQMISKSPIPVLIIRAKSHFIKESFSTFGGW